MPETPTNGSPAAPDAAAPLFDDFAPTPTEDWMAAIRKDLKGKDPEGFLTWTSLEGVDVRAFYRRDDLAGLAHVDPEAAPPLTASRRTPAGAWSLRYDLFGPDLDAARDQAADALAAGADALGLRLDVLDGAVRGLPLHRPDALAHVLGDAVDLAAVPVHVAAGPAALPVLAFLLDAAEAQGVAPEAVQGTLDFDPAAALATGRLLGPARAYDLAAALATYRAEHGLALRPLAVNLHPVHDAGGSMVQELGTALAALAELVAQLTERGVRAADVARALHVVTPVGTSYFLEIGRMRALRLLVPQVLAAFEVEVAPEDVMLQAITSRRVLSLYGAHVNMLRGATAAASAVLGGCDVLAVRPYDEVAAAPDAFGQRVARNTQLLLSHEAHLDQVADPAAGSYYIEQITDRLARAAWAFFQEVEAEGGLVAALEAGTIQRKVAEVRTQREAEMAERRRVMVGTNHYPDLTEVKLPAYDAQPQPTDGPQAFDAETPPPVGDPASVEGVREAVRQGATLVDVVAALEATGAAPSIDPLPRMRPAEAFEALRLRTERHAEATGAPPTVFLLPIGPGGWRSARATFARNVYGVAGFRLVEPTGFDTLDAGVAAALDAGADLVVLCSSDALYADLAPDLVQKLEAAGSAAKVVVAGNPDSREALTDAGVWGFVHRRSPLLQTLTETQGVLMRAG